MKLWYLGLLLLAAGSLNAANPFRTYSWNKAQELPAIQKALDSIDTCNVVDMSDRDKGNNWLETHNSYCIHRVESYRNDLPSRSHFFIAMQIKPECDVFLTHIRIDTVNDTLHTNENSRFYTVKPTPSELENGPSGEEV